MKQREKNTIVLSGGVVNLEKFTDSMLIVVKENTELNALNLHNNMNLSIKVLPNKSLIFNIFDFAITLDTNIELILEDNARALINAAFISEKEYNLKVDMCLYGDNTEGTLSVRGINEEGARTNIIMNGTVAGNTRSSVLNEYAKIINKSDEGNVLVPNMIVNTNEVEANHGVSVGPLNKDELFYLMCKGLDFDSASRMIEEGFILSIMTSDVQEVIKNILVGR